MNEPSLELIQALIQRILDGQGRHDQDLADLRDRVTAVDLGLAGMRRDMAALAEADAHLSARLDRLSDRLDRIERRLDLLPAG